MFSKITFIVLFTVYSSTFAPGLKFWSNTYALSASRSIVPMVVSISFSFRVVYEFPVHAEPATSGERDEAGKVMLLDFLVQPENFTNMRSPNCVS